MNPEDEELISRPVSRQDEMMRVAIAGFLGLFVVSMALAQSRVTPDPMPEPQFTPMAPALPTPPPVIVELPPPPPVAPLRASGDNRLYGRVVTSDGQEYEGYLRWDRNEGSWADLLDAKKRVPSRDVARSIRDEERRGAKHGAGNQEAACLQSCSSEVRVGECDVELSETRQPWRRT